MAWFRQTIHAPYTQCAFWIRKLTFSDICLTIQCIKLLRFKTLSQNLVGVYFARTVALVIFIQYNVFQNYGNNWKCIGNYVQIYQIILVFCHNQVFWRNILFAYNSTLIFWRFWVNLCYFSIKLCGMWSRNVVCRGRNIFCERYMFSLVSYCHLSIFSNEQSIVDVFHYLMNAHNERKNQPG